MNSVQTIEWQKYTQTFGQLEATVIAPSNAQVTHLCVLCHGYGAPGDDLVSIGKMIVSNLESPQIRPAIVFPQAPIDLTDHGLPGGRAWWPINMQRLMQLMMAGSFDELREETPPGMEAARDVLVEAIEAARLQLNAGHLPFLLGGFSQGAMLAIETALCGLNEPPQMLCVFSGATIRESKWTARISRLKETNILQSHGYEDMVLPYVTGEWLSEMLQKSGSKQYQMIRFRGGHGIPPEAIEALIQMLLAYDE